MLDRLTVVIGCGWPATGKGAVMLEVSEQLGIRWIDIDNVRVLNFGPPLRDPKPGPELEKDSRQMLGTYGLLIKSVGTNIAMGESIIVTATFSRAKYWEMLAKELSALAGPPTVKIVWCKPENDSDEEIERRLSKREFGVNCWSSMNTIRRYHENKDRFVPPPPPFLKLDTSPPHTIDECVNEAIAYILS